ncbi:MAG: hypothetical protein R3F56_08570 [Planctomycetota bacterium]
MKQPIKTFLLPGILLCVSTGALSAQADAELELRTEAVKKLDDYAKDAFEAGYPDRAEEIWREVLAEYDTNDPVARKALGYKQVGTSWAQDPAYRYPEWGEATLAKAKTLRKKFEKLAEDLAKLHLRAAEALAAAGNTERAGYHYDRVLRFQPGEPKAAAARSVSQFDGVFGTANEIAMLKRIRTLRRAVAQVGAMNVEVKATDERHVALEKAGVQMCGFEGPNITCYGNVEPAVVEEAVRVAERCLALCKLAFDGYPGFGTENLVRFECLCNDDETWSKILEANTALVGGGSLDFLREHKPAMVLRHGKTQLAFARTPAAATAYDLAARWVAQSFCDLKTDALVEGIGHTMVGLLLGRNLAYIIGEDREKGTVASRTRKLKLETPDLQVWQELAVDTAWENTSVPAAQLPFLQAASFPTEGRIKAWSFCYFLLLLDPGLMRKLDAAPGDQIRTPYELREKFTAIAGVHIDALDEQWRSFWTKDTPLLRAVRGGEIPALEGVSEEAFTWIDALNRLRKDLNGKVNGLHLPHVHWSEAYSEDCKLHVDYLEANKSERGVGKEDTEGLDKAGATPRGKQFAEAAIVMCTSEKPDKAVGKWMSWPGYRHVVFDPRLELVGAFATKSVMVMDVARGMTPIDRPSAMSYPFGGEKEVPTEVAVADLGDQVRRVLAAAGVKNPKKVGFPITLHMYGDGRGGLNPEPDYYKCSLLLQGKDPVPGVVHVAVGGTRRAHGTGLAAFYPLQPLKRGAAYTYQWTVGKEKEGRPQQFVTR